MLEHRPPSTRNRRDELLDRLSRIQPRPAALPTAHSKVNFRIAGVPIEISTPSESLASRVGEYFHDYLDPAPEGLQELRHRIHVETDPAGWLWEDIDPEFDVRGDSVVQRDFTARRVGANDAVAVLAPGLDDAFHNLLRWFLPPILLRHDAFLVHGAAVVSDGRGYAFFGQSEAGKSTTIRLITESDPAAIPLGDDGILIQMQGGTPMVLAAPLGCGYSRLAPPAISAPLHGLFALRQDSNHEIVPLSASEGVARLLASVMSVRFEEEIEPRFELALRFATARLGSSRGIAELRFRKDPGFWPLLMLKGT